ncbi:FtsX-like permease family protein [Halorarius litoreus]|uniref:FtsX-like permease family protein n=1 Tax=Halorarius litoreus TaxID=2962676 RepID=UPI0020CC1BF3|nr:ABC transporter permease [Halorarius litoreus]
MSYRRALLTRWSRRDRLAVLVVAVAVAFLTGTTLVVLAVGSSTAGIAAEFSAGAAVTEHQSVADAEAAAGPDAVVVPLATVETANGTATVVGVPSNASVGEVELRGGGEPSVGTLDTAQNVTLAGNAETVSLQVVPRGQSPFPSDWYVTDPATTSALGTSGALVVEPADGVPSAGVPLQGALAFFLAGTRSALSTLVVAAGVGAVLVGVTVYSVTRMLVRDRIRELFVLRATGRTRWQVRRLFCARGVLMLAIGIALGYAMGVIVTNIAVNVAVAVGLPTSLSTRVTGEAARFLAATYAGVFTVGLAATLLAVQPEVAKSPANIETSSSTYRLSGIRPQVLSERTAIPTAATLAAFVTFLLVVAGMAGVAGPLATTDDATFTEPGSTHPIASKVPANYAEPLRNQGIAASPEILLFAVHDGQPFPARGANYSAFSELSDARLVAGRTPEGPDEAVIGADLAETLGVDVGESMLVGGSVRPAVTRVEIVGAFEAGGADDDQLIVGLETARHLSNVRSGQVNFIRAERLPSQNMMARPTGPTGVTDLSAPASVAAGESFQVRVTLRNDALQQQAVETTLRVGDQTRHISTTVPATGQRTVTETFTVDDPGKYGVSADGVSSVLRVHKRDRLRLVGVPDRAPPGSQPQIRVVNGTGKGVGDVTVTVGDWQGKTAADGSVRVRLPEGGWTEVRASQGNQTVTERATVAGGALRSLDTTLQVSPSQPSMLTEPTLTVTLTNRWATPLDRTLTIAAPGGPYERTVTVPPSETRRISLDLPRQPRGRYDVTVSSEEQELAATSYRVTGDDRILSALATSGRSGTTGVGQAVAVALGNLELALGALILLGAGMTVGGAAATFAGAVHANREVLGLHRAVGATRFQVGKLVFGDALRLGLLAVAVAIAAGVLALELLDRLGLLTVYGVQISTTPSVPLLLGVAAASLVVVGAGAGVAVSALLAKQPADLVDGGEQL